jgi:hypothetical protein
MNQEEIQTKITDLAKQLELEMHIIEDPKVSLRVVLTEDRLPPIQLVLPKPETKYLLVLSQVSFSEEDYKRLVEMKYKEVEKIFWELRLRLLDMGVDFKTLKPEKIPITWEVHSKLFIEETTVQDFFEVYTKVKNSIFCIIWSIRRALDLYS